VFESIISVIIGAIDTKMISGLGKGAVSAVSFTSQPKLILLSIFFALGTAVSVFVAQALGRQDREEANAYFQTVLRITVSLSLVVGLLAGLLAGPIMSICNRQPDTVGMSVSFFRIINVAAMRGMGDAKSPRIMATVCVLFVNPAVAFMLTSVLPCGVWGIWIASLTSHLCWFTMSCVLEHRCMREALQSTA